MTSTVDHDSLARRRQEIESAFQARIDHALVARSGDVSEYARQQVLKPFWPIGLCVAWILKREEGPAAQCFARHRLGTEMRPVEGWREATTTLVNALGDKQIEASGLRNRSGEPAAIAAFEWAYSHLAQRGPYDEIKGRDGAIAYRDVKISAARMRELWPVEKPANNNARDKKEQERLCKEVLALRMRANPDTPTPKSKLRAEFPGVSKRAFDRAYSRAAEESGASAWTAPGRRRKA
jgi:hypothetical protein